jgi:hypothetical protein
MRYLHNIYTRQAVYVYRKIEARSRNHCCRGKSMSITYLVCVCLCIALVTQYAKRMLRSICLALPYFSTLCHNGTIFGEESYECKMCVLIFPITLSKTLLI